MKRQKTRPTNAQPQTPGLPAGRKDWLLGLFLVAVTIMAYQPAWQAGLVWDDDHHITPPALRSLHGLARIWTQLGATQQYYPLIHSVFWVEHRLWGEAAAGYHWLNILLHACSALLLVKILRQLKIPGAWLAAALFALHPVEVESVAWISELKNTLSGVFYLGAALAYLGFDRTRSGRNYALALGLFLLGLMCKTVIASLPAALLVVFWWQRDTLSWKRDARPLMPFFITGIGAGLLTAWVERKFIGAEGSAFDLSILERFLVAGRAIWFYLGKLLWPVDLAFIYPRWQVSQTAWWQYLFPAAALLLLGLLIWRRWRGPLAAMLFFVGTLFPALGFFNVFPFRYSFVADHFQYLASIGPLTLAAAGIAALPGLFRNGKSFLQPLLCAALLLVLAMLTWKQCGMYANAQTLWQTTLRLNPNCWVAHDNLADISSQQGRLDEAIAHFQKALAIRPDSDETLVALGVAFFHHGQVDQAIACYQKALAIQSDCAEAHYNLGVAFSQLGRLDEAIAHYQKALKTRADHAEMRNNLGLAFFHQGRMGEAITQYQKALEIEPDDADAHYNLGLAFCQQGRLDAAMAQYQKALETKPAFAQAHTELGLAFFQLGRMDDAILHFQKALEIKPDFAQAHLNLGAAFLQLDRADEAIAHFQKAAEIQPNLAAAQENLGMALLKKGSVREAISHFQKVLQIDPVNPKVENELAWLLATSTEASLRNGPQAVELAQQANTRAGGRDPIVLQTLAAALAEVGRFGDARSCVQQAMALAQAAGPPEFVKQLNDQLQRYGAGLPLHP
jgi:tetratricopeptide (TPR) repeat protein